MSGRRLLLAVALVAAGRAEAEGPAAKSDRAAMVGTWKIVSFQDDGGEKIGRLGVGPPRKKGDKPRVAKLVVTKDEIFVLKGDGTRDVTPGLTNCAWTTFTLDEKSGPKAIDVASAPGKDGKKKVYYGIYKLEKDKLTVCWNETPKGKDPAKVRPTKFESNGDMNLFVCERLSETPERPK